MIKRKVRRLCAAGFVRNYGYKYDNLNRLKDATYQKSGQVTGMYNENLSYDKNGNIMNLSRNGDRDEQYLPIQIDNLQYGYATNSNKLMSVVDNSNNTSGFKDGNTTGDDYVYDANGNMTVDKNKNITSIVYNHLNLPTKIIFPTGNIVYSYTASGQKMQKIVTEGTNTTTTDYLGGYHYQNTVLQFFPTVEGYVKNTSVSGTNSYSYVFNYTDHLGNVRISYTQNPSTNTLTILDENSYYPFGLKHTVSNTVVQGQDYKYKYNGKELQDELGLNLYDYGARNYMADIGRWGSIDNKSEKYVSLSPYHYAGNNPILYLDVDGNEFTEDAWKWVNRLIADINSRQEKNNSSIADYKAKIAEGGSDRQIARWNKNINSLTANNAELETTRGETATLAASSQVYDVVTNNAGTERDALGNTTTTNQTTFNSDNNRVQLTVSSGTDLGLFSHELKHMYQFETGETTLGLTKNNGGISLKGNNLLFYDLSDEVQAYQRGALFGQRENINSVSDVLAKGIYSDKIPSGPINAVNHPNAAAIKNNPQSFANSYNAAFRIGTTTYKPR
ncbi:MULTISPECIES: RHS repeat domain-containing protein [Flavobacterium]|uniref:RHS repeat-associated core domain-containing protein n=1 Tax=Flavobacterium keumense TaxID=1306518 RepID=A0ABY8N2Z9_9FLAO|nr:MULTISPECIES: RHS repeat-associated core domain-containing protein [Flavobacterium]WGK94044.1 hypothetical protein MG292_08130 [Flavobacterium keumense]